MRSRLGRYALAALFLPMSSAALRAGDFFVQKLEGTNVSFKMASIPAGSFQMGSPTSEVGRKSNEGPQHEVHIDAFYMEEHELTWAEYELFSRNISRLYRQPKVEIPVDKLADAVSYPTPIYELEVFPALDRMGGRGPTMPAVIMSQFAARQYTKWLSKKTGRFYRLPSEAEWEYAARAGSNTAYSFGDNPVKLGDFAWFLENSKELDGGTGYHAIMTKKPNAWGLYDMYGNVAEWCVDLYEADAYAGKLGATDPVNFAAMTKSPYPRVLRGGSYDSDAASCRSAARLASNRSMNVTDVQLPKSEHWISDGFDIGFRVVSPVKGPTEAVKRKWWNADDSITTATLERDRERREIVSPGKVEPR